MASLRWAMDKEESRIMRTRSANGLRSAVPPLTVESWRDAVAEEVVPATPGAEADSGLEVVWVWVDWRWRKTKVPMMRRATKPIRTPNGHRLREVVLGLWDDSFTGMRS